MALRSKPCLPTVQRRQRGMALIMVLLAMALVVMITAGMVQEQSVRVFRAGHILAQSHGFNVALGAEAMAKQALFEDLKDDRENNELVDSLLEPFWSRSLVYPLGEGLGVAEIQVDDLSGRINLNDLISPNGAVDQVTQERLMRLLNVLGITEIDVAVIIDWVDDNEETLSASGAEDGQYLMKDPPYRAANRPFSSVSELRLIDGMTGAIYDKLSPHVAALPVSGTGINVNMASAAVIYAVGARDPEQAQAIVKAREQEHFKTIGDFNALPQMGSGFSTQGLKVTTEFFEAVIRITFNEREVNLVSTMHRTPDGEFSVISRDTAQKNRIDKEPYGVTED